MSNYITKTGYISYECNTCKRSIDILQDNVRVFTTLCTITEHCQGKLHPVNSKTIRSILAASENANLTNWTSSGNQKIPDMVNTELLISLNSQISDIITVAVQEPTVGILPQLFYLRFNMSNSTNSFQEFVYSLSNFTEIIGTDNTSIGKVLRFTHSDEVLVYIEGKLLVEGQDYSLHYDPINNLGYSIKLVNEVYVRSSVRIVVFTSIPTQYSNSIKFTNNNLFTAASAWLNVKRIQIDNLWYQLYSTNELTVLPVNARLNLLIDSNIFTFTSLDKMRIVYANPNFTSIDRQLTSVVKLSNLTTPDKFFRVILQGSSTEFHCTPNLIDITMPIQIDRTSVKDIHLETASNLSPVSKLTNNRKETPSNILGVL